MLAIAKATLEKRLHVDRRRTVTQVRGQLFFILCSVRMVDLMAELYGVEEHANRVREYGWQEILDYGYVEVLNIKPADEIQLFDELVVGSFEPPDARVACDRIRRHFTNASYLLNV